VENETLIESSDTVDDDDADDDSEEESSYLKYKNIWKSGE